MLLFVTMNFPHITVASKGSWFGFLLSLISFILSGGGIIVGPLIICRASHVIKNPKCPRTKVVIGSWNIQDMFSSVDTNIRARIVGGSWRHEFSIYGYTLTIHFHTWLFCDCQLSYHTRILHVHFTDSCNYFNFCTRQFRIFYHLNCSA